MPLSRNIIFAAMLAAGMNLMLNTDALAQDEVYETETLEKDDKDKPRSRPSALGPITAIRPAALWMATLDTDQDYKITRAEYEAGLKATFDRFDTNSDNRLTLFDIEDWRKSALGSVDAAPHSLQFDNDYNSTITRAEFDSTLIAMFNSSDKNEDKVVTFNELVEIVERPQRRRRSDEQDERQQRGQRGGQRRR